MARMRASKGQNGQASQSDEGSSKSKDASTKTSFLSLPAELRNEIYKLALVKRGWPTSIRDVHSRTHRGRKIKKKWSRNSWREPAILRTCKEIRGEASRLYYGSNNFVVHLFMEDMAAVTAWILATVRTTGHTTAFLSLTMIVGHKAWGKLEHCRHLLELVSACGKDLARAKGVDSKENAPAEPQPPAICMSRNTGPYLRQAFQEIFELGQAAYEEAWTAEWLDDEFAQLLDKHRGTAGGKSAAGAEARVKRRLVGFRRSGAGTAATAVVDGDR